MSPDETYRWLIGASAGGPYDAFDIHVMASVLALAMSEAKDSGCGVAEGMGIEPRRLAELIGRAFPAASGFADSLCGDAAIVIGEEEQSLRDILAMYSSGASCLERYLAAIIARRCKWPHHLWQDLGLRDRGELSRLMNRYFARLAEKNRNGMKWKKFLYRMVCGSQGFTLCAAPVCSECDEFANCFGAEDGEARLARNTREKAA